MASSLRDLDDKVSAIIELRAAHAVFDRLGACPDAAQAIASIETLSESLPAQYHLSNM